MPTALEVVTAVGAFCSVFGVIADHIWVRRKLHAANKQEHYHRIADLPMRAELARIVELSSDVSDWQRGRGGDTNKIQSAGMRLSRQLNQAINLLAGSNLERATCWLDIDTEDLDDALSALDGSPQALIGCTIEMELTRIQRKITDLLSELRPK